MIALDDISSLVLCGGQGRRFAHRDKPLVPYAGDLGLRPMVDYVIHRLPPTAELLISANRNIEDYAQRGKVIQDVESGLTTQGPLVGIYAGLIACSTPWLLVCPGDMPLLPFKWYQPLLEQVEGRHRARVLHDGERLQSLLCLVPRSLAEDLGSFIRSGDYAVRDWHARSGATECPANEDPKAFVNINSEADLDNL
jgi:molybdopterin-guanine dinucleotide biosynthesis protein A